MKRIFAIALAAMMLLSLCACGDKKETASGTNADQRKNPATLYGILVNALQLVRAVRLHGK